MLMIDILQRNAAQYTDTVAVCDASRSLTYAQLLTEVQAEADRLCTVEHVQPGQLYQFVATQDVAYVVRFLALHVVGAISVPLDALSSDMPAYVNPAVSDILFTTGSTSRPKGVLLSFDAVLADADNLIRAHRYSHDLTFIVCGPIHHFGCWSKVMPTLVAGATLRIMPGLKDLEALLSALGDAPRTATFLVPSAIRMLMQFSSVQLQALASNIDFIETGAAPIATTDMEQLRQLLPNTRLYNTYASTETGVVCTYPFHLPSAEGLQAQPEPCVAGCVGPTMHHARIHLDAEGHICVTGPMIMSGYLPVDDAPTPQPPTEIVTSDIGRLDDRGYLYITGRDSDFINVGGLKVAPAEVEDVASAFPTIGDCICIPAQHPVMGQVPRLLVVVKPGCAFDRKALIAHLKQHLETFKIPLLYQEVPEIHKTFNGKKDRKSYIA